MSLYGQLQAHGAPVRTCAFARSMILLLANTSQDMDENIFALFEIQCKEINLRDLDLLPVSSEISAQANSSFDAKRRSFITGSADNSAAVGQVVSTIRDGRGRCWVKDLYIHTLHTQAEM